MIDPVRPIALSDIERRANADRRTVLRTPLVKMDLGRRPPEIWLKLENLQPTNAYKIRGATNAVASCRTRSGPGRLDDQRRQCRAGGRLCGAPGRDPCSVVAIETAPQTKLDRMRALGATIVPVSYEQAWKAPRPMHSMGSTAPSSTRSTIMISSPATAPWGWRSSRSCRTCAPSSRDRRRRADHRRRQRGEGAPPEVRVLGAEPETAAPYAYSLRAGRARASSRTGRPRSSTAPAGRASPNGCGSGCSRSSMGRLPSSLDQTRAAMRLIAEKTRTISEGAGALALAAALTGKPARGRSSASSPAAISIWPNSAELVA